MHVKKLSAVAAAAALAAIPFTASTASAHPEQCPGPNAASTAIYTANSGLAHASEEVGAHGAYDATAGHALHDAECAVADLD